MQGRLAARMFGETEPQPRRIANYQLEQRIGAGGMGIVYAAHDDQLDRRVALKLLRRDRVHARGRARLLSEARTLARLSHPNVVQVYEVGEDHDDVFIAMELVEGRDVLRWQRSERPSLPDLLDAYIQAALGLAAAHEVGIVHLDFKASNLLRGSDGRVRVADFGLAEWVAEPETGKLHESRIMGTPGYMAPEVLWGTPADARADQFSFCAALWEACSGQLPFGAELNPSEFAGPLSRLSPRWLERVLMRGLADEPADRWPSMNHLVAELRAVPIRRKRRRLVAVGVTLLGLAALVLPGPPTDTCEAGVLEEVWTADRRATIAALADSPTTTSLLAEADRFADRWRATHERSCQQPGEHRAGALACLNRRARRFDRTLAVFEGDLELGEAHFDALLEQLGDPGTCEADEPLDPPAALALAVAGLRERIDAARIELSAGHVAAAEAEARSLVAATRGHDFPPVEAEAHDLLGLVLAGEGHSRAAIDEHRAAARIAETTRDLPLLFTSRVHAALAALDSNDASLAHEWLVDARTSLAMLNSPAELEVELLFAESKWASEGDHQDLVEAAALVRRALALTDPNDEPLRGRLNQRLANVLGLADQDEEALVIYEQLARSYRARLGDDALLLGVTYYNIGLSEQKLGRLEQALDHLERAFVIEQAALGDSPKLGEIHLAIASVAFDQGRFDRALVHAERAKQLRPQPQLSVELAWTLAMTLTELGRHVEALQLYESAPLQALSDDAMIINRAWLRCRVSACRGFEGFDALGGLLADPLGNHARLILANRDLVEGRPTAALVWIAALLERVDAQASVGDELEAEAAWLGAWALQSEQPERAKERAGKALEYYRNLGRPQQVAALIEILGGP